MKHDYPDLSRTAAALEEYDRVDAVFQAQVGKADQERSQNLMNAVNAAGRQVAEAFADDTADRNARNSALLMRPTPKRSSPENDCTVRKWVRKFQVRAGRPVTV